MYTKLLKKSDFCVKINKKEVLITMKKMKENLMLFWSFFKIGAFTFGGGLAMLPLMNRICVEKHKWMTEEEMVDMLAIAESTPGVIAINLATYVGYKLNKFFGALFATLGVIVPSFTIICIISFFYEKFIAIEVISWAFMGIKACVAVMILNSAIKLFKHVKRNVFSFIVLAIAFLLALFVPAISTVYIILAGLVIGVAYYAIAEAIHKKKESIDPKESIDSKESIDTKGGSE